MSGGSNRKKKDEAAEELNDAEKAQETSKPKKKKGTGKGKKRKKNRQAGKRRKRKRRSRNRKPRGRGSKKSEPETKLDCPHCGRSMGIEASVCECGAKYREDDKEVEAEITNFFEELWQTEPVESGLDDEEIAKRIQAREARDGMYVAAVLLGPPGTASPGQEADETEPKDEADKEGESEDAPDKDGDGKEVEAEDLPGKGPEPEGERAETSEPQEATEKEDSESAPGKGEEQIDESEGPIEPEVPEIEEEAVKEAPLEYDEPPVAEIAYERVRRDRIMFYFGTALLFLGGPIIAYGSWIHDWLRIPIIGNSYDAFGWINEFYAIIGIIILVVGIIFIIVSARGGVITNKKLRALKTEGIDVQE
jgi:hypothetical protein